MIDFLKANPYVTREEYMWQWTLPQIQLASIDFTHTVYLTEKQAEKRKARDSGRVYEDPLAFMRDMGF